MEMSWIIGLGASTCCCFAVFLGIVLAVVVFLRRGGDDEGEDIKQETVREEAKVEPGHFPTARMPVSTVTSKHTLETEAPESLEPETDEAPLHVEEGAKITSPEAPPTLETPPVPPAEEELPTPPIPEASPNQEAPSVPPEPENAFDDDDQDATVVEPAPTLDAKPIPPKRTPRASGQTIIAFDDDEEDDE